MSASERLGPRVSAVLVGRAVPFSRPGSFSAIAKSVVTGPVDAGPDGLRGDEHGDPRVHGGVDKAVHLYACEHYAAWRAELGPLGVLDRPGAFGENLSTAGLTEDEVCIGDRIRVGTALLEVTQSRQPCWKLNDRFQVPDMALRVQRSLRAGWYLRVLQPGTVQAGDTVWLLARPQPAWPIARLLEVIDRRDCTPATLREILALPLPPSWQRLFQRRLDSGQSEAWDARLQGQH